MAAYYNEINKYAAQWLRNLISRGLIAPGDVDERSISDVRADDVRGYTQCHWFAGIGGWSIALRLAGWDDARPIWSGSCPCQPFSSAGAGKAANDQRHLWPAWFPLIAECRPATVYGEQVEAAIGWGWLDAVFADLESQSYACRVAVLPACSVGAPHIRQRLWFVADAAGIRRNRYRALGGSPRARENEGRLLKPAGTSHEPPPNHLVDVEHMADTDATGLQRCSLFPKRANQWTSRPSGLVGELGDFWSACDWLPCTDGKARPVEPGTFPLVDGIQRRASKLRAYGNAIVPQLAAEFIKATI